MGMYSSFKLEFRQRIWVPFRKQDGLEGAGAVVIGDALDGADEPAAFVAVIVIQYVKLAERPVNVAVGGVVWGDGIVGVTARASVIGKFVPIIKLYPVAEGVGADQIIVIVVVVYAVSTIVDTSI